MSAPAFGDTAALDRPTFGTRPGAVSHRCIAPFGFACPSPGPHLPPAPVDPATVALFPELEPTPTLWAAGLPAEHPPDVPEHHDPRPEPEPARLEPDPCPVRWSDTADGFLMPCHLRAGHAGRHV